MKELEHIILFTLLTSLRLHGDWWEICKRRHEGKYLVKSDAAIISP